MNFHLKSKFCSKFRFGGFGGASTGFGGGAAGGGFGGAAAAGGGGFGSAAASTGGGLYVSFHLFFKNQLIIVLNCVICLIKSDFIRFIFTISI